VVSFGRAQGVVVPVGVGVGDAPVDVGAVEGPEVVVGPPLGLDVELGLDVGVGPADELAPGDGVAGCTGSSGGRVAGGRQAYSSASSCSWVGLQASVPGRVSGTVLR